MKALVYAAPGKLDYKDVADPQPASGEVLVKISDVGVCGSDMHAFLGHDERRLAPLILGHEAAGIVVGGTRDGMRVTINPLVTCGTCAACRSGRDNLCADRQIISMPPREGAFAEWLAIPALNLVEVPQDVPLEKAALTEALACGWHAVQMGIEKLHNPVPASINALVIGGGAVGVGSALSLVAKGMDKVTVVEPNATRREYIAQQCRLHSVEPKAVSSLEYNLIIDAVGIEQSRAMASAAVMPGGVIVHIGLGSATGGLDIRRMTLQEISFIGSYTYSFKDFKDTAEAIFTGLMGPLDWIEQRPLSAGLSAFVDMRNGKVKSPKIILKPN